MSIVRKKYGFLLPVLLTLTGIRTFAQNSSDIVAYINNYKQLSMAEMQRTGVPAAIILAQGIHETEAGTSELVKQSNNHFGIKCKDSWTGSVVYHDDDAQGECFRSYASAQDSYRDHSDFLRSSPRYQFLFRLDPLNYSGWAYGLRKAGYATNKKYSQILIKLIRDYNLQQYSLIAIGKLRPSDEVLAAVRPAATAPEAESAPGISLEVTDSNSSRISPAKEYPEGVFMINNARVVFVRAGASLLSLADQYDVPLAHLLDFNDLNGEEILVKDQLIFLQRKRKTGDHVFHQVKPGESLYDICQSEGIRMESLLALNRLQAGEQVAPGRQLALQEMPGANARPAGANGQVQQSPSGISGKDSAGTMMPTPITHIVQTKETLYSISRRYGVEVERIQAWNKLDSLNLRTGQELIIYKY